MRVIPPEVPQPQQIVEKAPNKIELQANTEEKIVNNGENTVVTAPSQFPIINNETPEIQIRKKAQYKAFMKLIKDKKYTSAVLTSRVLGVDRATLTSWLQTKKVRELMESEYESYVNKISGAKDWKAQAYLLDKLEDKDNIKDTPVTLNNLIQINI